MEEYNNLTGAEYTTIGTSLFGGVTGWLGSKENRKGLEAQADALRAKGLSEVEVARLMLEGKKLELESARLGGGAKTGSSALYIGLGVGAVVILGIVIFAVTRKKA